MKLRLFYSSCPNDTFIFGAIATQQIPLPFTFEIALYDIKELNQLAHQQAAEVIKISAFAYVQLQDKYQHLDAGGAVGYGCGPLLVAKKPQPVSALEHQTIAIPGWDTTAHLLLRFFLPFTPKVKVYRFDQIIPAVLNEEVAAGVIIHEGRFVYQNYGLVCLQDLGNYWEQKTGLPIPLGIIVAHRSLNLSVIQQLNEVIRQSIHFAFEHPDKIMPYVQQHAQELSEEVQKRHIET